MIRHSRPRVALLLVLPGVVQACNVYTDDLLLAADPTDPESGGTGGDGATDGGTAGRPTGGIGGIGTGGTHEGSGGSEASGGVSVTGGTGGESTGGSGGNGGESTGGMTTGGASGTTTGGAGDEGGSGTGGSPTGGDSPGGATTGGANTGGVTEGGAAGADTSGAPTGGVPTGGTATGGTATGGAATGGAATGGAATGGVPTGGVGTGGLPPGITAIDMLDEENDTIELQDGQGAWYVFHDGSTGGVITPDTLRDSTARVIPVALPAPRDGSLLGVHVVADAGFTSWGAGVGFNLNSPDSATRLEYDVSSYTGIVLWARTGTGTVTLRLKLVTADIAPDSEPGGECATNCNDAYGYVLDLSDVWQEYPVPFSALTQQGWGYTPATGFDPTRVLTVQVHVDASVAFDIWLDDVRFYE